MEESRTDSAKGTKDARQLAGGVIRGSLQTGPANPLILPPHIASVVYVLDCSGSMTGDKFDRVIHAVSDAVAQMQEDQKFTVLMFDTGALREQGGGYRPATLQNARALEQALASVSPDGGTNPEDALLLAIQLKPESVVVISDGEFQSHVVHRVTRLNRSSGTNTQINCIAVGSKVTSLQLLASLNGPGNYVEAP